MNVIRVNLMTMAMIWGVYLGTLMVPSLAAEEAAPSVAAIGSVEGGGGTPTEVPPATVKPQTLWKVICGGGWIMIPLAVISVWCLALVIELFVRIRPCHFMPAEVVQQLRNAFAQENYPHAWRICKINPVFLTNSLRNMLEYIGQGRETCDRVLAEHALKESMIHRTRISYLSTIGVVSPMVGLLGTVTGMVKAFQALGTEGIANPAMLAAAIGEVLVATATGLMVAIPAFFLYYFFRNRLQMMTVMAEDVMHRLMRSVKFSELQGLQIGEDSQSVEYEVAAEPTGNEIQRRVSQRVTALDVVCPQCQAPLLPGIPKCPQCGIELQWGEAPAEMSAVTV